MTKYYQSSYKMNTRLSLAPVRLMSRSFCDNFYATDRTDSVCVARRMLTLHQVTTLDGCNVNQSFQLKLTNKAVCSKVVEISIFNFGLNLLFIPKFLVCCIVLCRWQPCLHGLLKPNWNAIKISSVRSPTDILHHSHLTIN